MQEQAHEVQLPSYIKVVKGTRQAIGNMLKDLASRAGTLYQADDLLSYYEVFEEDSTVLHAALGGEACVTIVLRALWEKVAELAKRLSGDWSWAMQVGLDHIVDSMRLEKKEVAVNNEAMKGVHMKGQGSLQELVTKVISMIMEDRHKAPPAYMTGPRPSEGARPWASQGSKRPSSARYTKPEWVDQDVWDYWVSNKVCFAHAMLAVYPAQAKEAKVFCDKGNACERPKKYFKV
jgi:hypothetical protein